MIEPYYFDETVTLYKGDCREVLTLLGRGTYFDCAVADPPYGETTLAWDRWPDGWPAVVAEHTNSMWCFGSMRMFLARHGEVEDADWKISQDIIGADEDGDPIYADVHVVWQKRAGSGPAADRFKRIHEHALHWYQDAWADIYHDTPRVPATPEQLKRNGAAVRSHRGEHIGNYGQVKGWTETGTRLMQSVIPARSMHHLAIHPTEKPVTVLDPLIRYACPPGGIVLDPFAGSGSTAVAARMSGRRAVLIEGHEPYCEAIANRLQQDVLPIGGESA